MAKKYIVFGIQAQASYIPDDLPSKEGNFTLQILNTAEKNDIPLTWFTLADRETETGDMNQLKTISNLVLKHRKDIDEFALEAHFKYFVQKTDDENSPHFNPANRLRYLNKIHKKWVEHGFPPLHTFRYGGGDMSDGFYCIEDIEFLGTKFNAETILLRHPLHMIKGVNEITDNGAGNFRLNDQVNITPLYSPETSIDKSFELMMYTITKILEHQEFAIITGHDYAEKTATNLASAIKYLKYNFDVEFVTLQQLNQLAKKSKVKFNPPKETFL